MAQATAKPSISNPYHSDPYVGLKMIMDDIKTLVE